MKKIIACKPINEVELQFQSGESLSLRFDIEAMMALNNLDGGIQGIIDKGAKMTDICAKVIYAGSIGGGNEITIEKAREIVCQLNPVIITEIVQEFTKCMETEEDEATQELVKKKTAEFLTKNMR